MARNGWDNTESPIAGVLGEILGNPSWREYYPQTAGFWAGDTEIKDGTPQSYYSFEGINLGVNAGKKNIYSFGVGKLLNIIYTGDQIIDGANVTNLYSCTIHGDGSFNVAGFYGYGAVSNISHVKDYDFYATAVQLSFISQNEAMRLGSDSAGQKPVRFILNPSYINKNSFSIKNPGKTVGSSSLAPYLIPFIALEGKTRIESSAKLTIVPFDALVNGIPWLKAAPIDRGNTCMEILNTDDRVIGLYPGQGWARDVAYRVFFEPVNLSDKSVVNYTVKNYPGVDIPV